jgi:fatty acid desaturase
LSTTDLAGRLPIQWPTLLIFSFCYIGFFAATVHAQSLGFVPAIILLTLSLTLYSSFQHEVLHGHPFQSNRVNQMLVFPALGLLIPYLRFRDTHLAHHHDPSLTDPYDDPETNFIDPAVWESWPYSRRRLYQWNNTLLGRIILGPAISLATFYRQDLRRMLAGNRAVINAYLFHLAGVVPVICWLAWMGEMPFAQYVLAVYLSLSVLKIRTFLEHRAHEKARCRSVIIEDRGILSLLFLKNNLHAVHHAYPTVPWYHLQAFYQARRDEFLTRNGGYVYRSYRQIIALFLLRAKDPVAHSLWQAPRAERAEQDSTEKSATI